MASEQGFRTWTQLSPSQRGSGVGGGEQGQVYDTGTGAAQGPRPGASSNPFIDLTGAKGAAQRLGASSAGASSGVTMGGIVAGVVIGLGLAWWLR